MYTPKDIYEVLERMKSEIEAKGHIVFAIALKGSQNYNLHDEESDIDANAILIPTLKDFRDPKKHKFEFPEGEVTAHNIYDFASIVCKGNPQWVETCNSQYYIGDFSLFKNARVDPRALGGMAREKAIAFSKRFPSRAEYIDKYGYDPKQLHHIIRLSDLLESGKNVLRYSNEDRDWMMGLKRGQYPGSLEEAERLRDEYMSKIDEKIKELGKPENVEIDYDSIDSIVMEYLVKHYKKG